MTKIYDNTLEEHEQSDLALINALTSGTTLVKSLMKQQTCRKSTGGFLKYSNLNLMQQQQQQQQQQQSHQMSYMEARSKSRSVSNDSSLNLNYDESCSGGGSVGVNATGGLSSSSTGNSPQMGIKMVIKRQSGDKYEVKNSTNMSMSLNESMFLANHAANNTMARYLICQYHVWALFLGQMMAVWSLEYMAGLYDSNFFFK